MGPSPEIRPVRLGCPVDTGTVPLPWGIPKPDHWLPAPAHPMTSHRVPHNRDQGIRTDQRLHSPHPGGSGFLLGVLAWVGLGVLVQYGFMFEARAERIRWGSVPNQEHLTSTGRPLDASWQFELGTFSKGFEPTQKNTADWAAHWIPIQRTRYNPTTRWFTALTTVTGLEPGIVPGDPVFVWGFGNVADQNEWILFRSESWRWPKPNPANPVPRVWSARTAERVVLGSVHNTASKLQIVLSNVQASSPPRTTWSQWREAELTGKGADGPMDDINQDGVPNVVEFILGRSPSDPAQPAKEVWLKPVIREVGGAGRLEIRVPRRTERPVQWDIAVSEDLAAWRSAEGEVEVLDDGSDAFVVRDRRHVSESGVRRFLRIQPRLEP